MPDAFRCPDLTHLSLQLVKGRDPVAFTNEERAAAFRDAILRVRAPVLSNTFNFKRENNDRA